MDSESIPAVVDGSTIVRPPCIQDDTRTQNNMNELDLLCFSHLRWNFVTQRPQHLLNRAALDRRVFYWEEPVWHAEGDLPLGNGGELGKYLEVTRVGESLWVLCPHITWGIDFEAGQQSLLDTFVREQSISAYVAWYYTPMAFGFSSHLTPKVTAYDCMDELSAFQGAPTEMIAREEKLFAAADVVFTGGISLYEYKRNQHSNVHAFPSSVEVAHFAGAKTYSQCDPPDQLKIPHPRAGFFGVIDERLDIELIAEVARLRPEVHLVMLGPVVKIDASSLPQAANIHWLGSKTYKELPSYIAGWDVAMLPFALNAATRFISPTKTPEYLAAGRPVVSTPIHDVVEGYGRRGLVRVAGTPESFALALDQSLVPQEEIWAAKVAAALAAGSWDTTWFGMNLELQRVHRLKLALTDAQLSAEGHDVTSATNGAPGRGIEASAETGRMRHCAGLSSFVSTTSGSLTMTRNQASARASASSKDRFDYLVVGAGFAGSVIAERLVSQLGKRVLIIDKRDHIGGNAYDYYNEDGILIHRYGPHIFHTNSEQVINYLSQFTEWRPYEHRVLASVAGQLLPIPINLDTINRLYTLSLDGARMREFLDERVIASSHIRTSEDIVISRVGVELYELFFRNYTRKQWGLDPSQLDASVAGRVPVRFDQDDRYFTDSFQAMPDKGYTVMFGRMLDHAGITIQTETSYDEAVALHPTAKVIYTGPIDEYYGFRFGPLPYRSLEFKHQTLNCKTFQPAPVVNYPNDHAYTRITEFKYLTGQEHEKTSVVYEYPGPQGEPYYPIPRPENSALYQRYAELAQADDKVVFCGRLATYRYLNMDQVVAQALQTFKRISQISAGKANAYSSVTVNLNQANGAPGTLTALK